MRPQRFDTKYITGSGVLMILAETYFVLVRISDGKCQRFEYADFGI